MAFWDGVSKAVGAAANKAMIHTAINSGGTAQSASFSVDIEQIPGLIASYEDAREKMERILQKAQQLGNLQKPGEDEVSTQLTESLKEMAGHKEGCLSWAVADGVKRLTNQIEQLKAAQREYQTADENATARQV
ncbi:hypothetical protein SAMN05421805_1207 [Saccharopolyspora antimicrobica]|uniref:PE family protein n=1 Tax=Saccharopolyspora antimicrobica TaxID=455193 RepID=A0A1I5IV98_9PSEU|nr:hypothetical protein [Saccharopolyspora antimicrobica]RKT83721.1 hypothetical protein ATL45_2015 [Saccharopolyspora antimicrobica]SFO64505.1 hypothetical protein SAMN05421805_1207 [Saccharopolyspora antimicrobica]